jgi:DNA-binding LytR/AlgR family response regulator
MKIEIKPQKKLDESKITIEYQEGDPKIEEIIDYIKFQDLEFIGKKNDRSYVIRLNDIFYIESSEEQCLLYTKDDVYECRYRLYQVESMHHFLIRVNKNVVVNYKKIKHFKSTLNGKLEASLLNQDRIEISRRYVSDLKSILEGVK